MSFSLRWKRFRVQRVDQRMSAINEDKHLTRIGYITLLELEATKGFHNAL